MFSRLWKEGSEGSSDVERGNDRQNQVSDSAEARNGCEAPPDQDQLGPGERPRRLAEKRRPAVDSGQREAACDPPRDGDEVATQGNLNVAARPDEGFGQDGKTGQNTDEELEGNEELEPDKDSEPDESFDSEEGFLLDADGETSVVPKACFVPAAGPRRRRKPRLAVDPEEVARQSFSPQQRLLLLDTWQRSGLPAKDFAALVGVSKHTLYKWKQLFEQSRPGRPGGPARGARRGSRLPEVTRRTILMLKQSSSRMGVPADQRCAGCEVRRCRPVPSAVCASAARGRLRNRAGADPPASRRRPARSNGPGPTSCGRPTSLRSCSSVRTGGCTWWRSWTTTVGSSSRTGLHASASTALVIEVLEAGIANYGPPEEILTDNGPQYVTWRGKSQFTKQLEKRGIRQIVARPRRPQTLGKIERFWGTLWRELIEAAVFVDLADARERIGHFLDYYNFQRTHTGIDGLVPADRFFDAADQVRRHARGARGRQRPGAGTPGSSPRNRSMSPGRSPVSRSACIRRANVWCSPAGPGAGRD